MSKRIKSLFTFLLMYGKSSKKLNTKFIRRIGIPRYCLVTPMVYFYIIHPYRLLMTKRNIHMNFHFIWLRLTILSTNTMYDDEFKWVIYTIIAPTPKYSYKNRGNSNKFRCCSYFLSCISLKIGI